MGFRANNYTHTLLGFIYTEYTIFEGIHLHRAYSVYRNI